MSNHDEDEIEEIITTAPPIIRPYFGASNWRFEVRAHESLTNPFYGAGANVVSTLMQQSTISHTILGAKVDIETANLPPEYAAIILKILLEAGNSTLLRKVFETAASKNIKIVIRYNTTQRDHDGHIGSFNESQGNILGILNSRRGDDGAILNGRSVYISLNSARLNGTDKDSLFTFTTTVIHELLHTIDNGNFSDSQRHQWVVPRVDEVFREIYGVSSGTTAREQQGPAPSGWQSGHEPYLNSDHSLGTPGNDRINGGAGYDNLHGGAGNDRINGGSDNDILNGGAGSDRLSGGSGIDVASYEGSSAGVNVNLLTGRGTGGHAQGDRLSSIENLRGSGHNDTLHGSNGQNVLYGEGGNDQLYGKGGDDWLQGGAGNDTLFAGGGNDTLFGGAGNDVMYAASGLDQLHGGTGNDQLFGGTDNDIIDGNSGAADEIYGAAGNDTLSGGAGADKFYFARNHGRDVITDFEVGSDILVLTNTRTDFTNATSVRNASRTATIDGETGVLVNTGSGTIFLEGLTLSQLNSLNYVF